MTMQHQGPMNAAGKAGTRIRDMDLLFNPRSIAFVGATEFSLKWGFLVLNNLLAGGYRGKIYPVNPGRQSVMGMPAYPSVREVPGEVDLAVFTVPASQVLRAMDDCAAKGVRAALVITAGFRELGGENEDLERELVKRARAAGMVLAGPNGQGICCPANRLFPWMPLFFPPDGPISFVSQSGNVLNMLISAAYRAGSGVAKAVSSGNEADLRMEDYLAYFAEDPATEVIAAYSEGTPDGRRFFETVREVSKRKPVILMKGGRTSSGTAAARSHTGAMAVSDDLYAAACRQAGVIRARSADEAGILAASFYERPLPRGRRVGIVTGGGGLGVICADLCSDAGLEVVSLSRATLESIGKRLPPWWVPANPIDLVAGLDFSVTLPIIETLMRSGEVDSIIFTFVGVIRDPAVRTPLDPHRGMDLQEMWHQVSSGFVSRIPELYGPMRELGVPLFVVSNLASSRSDKGIPATREGNGVTVYSDLETACRAAAVMADYAAWRRLHS